LKTLCPDHRFDCLVISACEGVAKPHPALYHKAAEQLGLDPANIVHVGDEIENDFQAARNAGFQALLIERQKENRKLAESSLYSLHQIPDFLKPNGRISKR
jgi:putative hydrolase of the HAD superfamily